MSYLGYTYTITLSLSLDYFAKSVSSPTGLPINTFGIIL